MNGVSLLDFPGGDIVEIGLAALQERRVTEEALLILIALPRFLSMGFAIPSDFHVEWPEMALYRAIELRLGDGAHAEYNSLNRKMVSFANAYEQIGMR